MAMKWRWDQGRLAYFKYENLKIIARVLYDMAGNHVFESPEDSLRMPLTQATGLPFLPTDYKVWRNYGRVFKVSMLATRIQDRLVPTELCRYVANDDNFTSDQYFNFVFSHFAYPFPAFEDYNERMPVVYPFVVIIKYLLAHPNVGVSLDEVFNILIANNCTGEEDLDYYRQLPRLRRMPIGDEDRQVREILNFMGQASFLKWYNSRLYLDTRDIQSVWKAITPYPYGVRSHDPEAEFIRMTVIQRTEVEQRNIFLTDREDPEFAFTEGGRIFVSHCRIERSPLIRRIYFETHPNLICNACHLDPHIKYPWTNNILELHHILPLSSTINTNGTTTTLDDLVPLCPTCHKSIHVFYRQKLQEMGRSDFQSRQIANNIYKQAIDLIIQ